SGITHVTESLRLTKCRLRVKQFLRFLILSRLDKTLPFKIIEVYKVMSRNRFEELLQNSNCDATNANFSPGQEICVDESMIPFRGRLSFRQYLKGKLHKFGIKVFRLSLNRRHT